MRLRWRRLTAPLRERVVVRRELARLGAPVTFQEKVRYKIVGDFEANLRDGKISISSPIARALIGKSKGETCEVTTPKGARSFEILKVEWK